MSGGLLVLVGVMLTVAFILSSHLLYLRFPGFRYAPSVVLALAALGQIASAGIASPGNSVIHIGMALLLGLVFLFTVLFTAFLPLWDRHTESRENTEQ